MNKNCVQNCWEIVGLLIFLIENFTLTTEHAVDRKREPLLWIGQTRETSERKFGFKMEVEAVNLNYLNSLQFQKSIQTQRNNFKKMFPEMFQMLKK